MSRRLALAALLAAAPCALQGQNPVTDAADVLRQLVESYGPSGAEGPVR